MMPNIKEIVAHHPYLIPVLIVLLLWLALVWAYRCWTGVLRASSCEHCPEQKWICIVACEKVSRRLDLVDQEIDLAESPYHPCRGCMVECKQACLALERWELHV